MPRLNRLHQNRVTHPTAIESAHVEAYVERLQNCLRRRRALAMALCPKTRASTASSPEPAMASALTPYRHAPFNDVTRVRGTPSFQLGVAHELLEAW